MRKIALMKMFLFLSLYLSLHIVVPQSYGNEYVVRVDASAHQKFGLFYPATYRFAIPPGAAGLVAQYRYSPDAAWATLAEKSSGDIFNGIDAVRFDYAGGWAYVSVAFSHSSDQIYLRMLNGAGDPVNFTFASIPKYYDGRKAAVTVTLDDWNMPKDEYFRAAASYLDSYGLYFTVGVVTGYADWNSIQQTIDRHGEYLEVASHGAMHLCSADEYAGAGYDTEIIGSRDAIRNNLSFRGHPYVPAFFEPCAYTDATLVSTVTAANYLVTRSANDYFPTGSTFVAWDPLQGRYGKSGIVYNDFSHAWDAAMVAEGNALFDQTVAIGGIYHLMDHPRPGYWYDGSLILRHLDYIHGRNDIWYAPLGQLYLYHFLQEMRGSLSIRSLETTPIASFRASPSTGAAPLAVSFTDTSTGSITGRLWDFGDSTTSSEQNPVHVYNGAGSYTVRLTVTGPGGSDERVEPGAIGVNNTTTFVTFYVTPSTGTAPLSVSFNDTSLGSITARLWDFGDATTSTEQNPVHVYTSGGSYTVKLTVTGPQGRNERVEPGLIVVNSAPPVAHFSAAPGSGSAPLAVSFTDTSTGSITARLWDFGDSTTSTDQNPVHVYHGAGSYTVRLTVTGPGGSNETVQPSCVVVGEQVPAPVANFSATPRTGSVPVTVSFTDTSTGSITARLWDFGDATTSTGQNPVHVYNSAGSYTVKLRVTGPGGSNEKTQVGYIVLNATAPNANFSATPRSGAAPMAVTFTDTSTGSITGRLWDFGDSTTSTEENPVHLYDRAGVFTVKLTVTGPKGSSEKSQTGYINLKWAAPTAKFSAAPRTGSAPLTVSFTDTSSGSITGRLWDFGDSTTSTEENPVHVYNSAGSYTVTLTATGPKGSNEKILSRYIVVK